MTDPIRLRVGRAYRIAGMEPHQWGNAHPKYGQPAELAGVYLGSLPGTRTWHLFEIRIAQQDAGVILMSTEDMKPLTITEVNGS